MPNMLYSWIIITNIYSIHYRPNKIATYIFKKIADITPKTLRSYTLFIMKKTSGYLFV